MNPTTNSSCPASSSIWDSITGAYNKAKESVSDVFTSNDSSASTAQITGGKRKRRKHKGGKPADNISLTNIASHSAKIEGINSAKPHQMTRGGTKRRRKNKRKSKKHTKK